MNRKSIALVLGILALVSQAISNIVEAVDTKIAPISWLASTLIMLEMFYLRTKLIDSKRFEEFINDTNPYGKHLNPGRYLNWITVAMVIGLISTITIWYNFIFGMISYLIMHICLITAFSGIMSLNPKTYLKDGKKGPLLSLIGWIILTATIYIGGVYNGSESLIVIPYVIFLGTMAHFTWYNLSYPQRPRLFNTFPIIASAIFVFSDAMIGNARFGLYKIPEIFFFFIDTTYVINLFFMINGMLFLPTKVFSNNEN